MLICIVLLSHLGMVLLMRECLNSVLLSTVFNSVWGQDKETLMVRPEESNLTEVNVE